MGSSGNNGGTHLYVHQTLATSLKLSLGNDTGTSQIDSGRITIGKWYHIAYCYNELYGINLFVDGIKSQTYAGYRHTFNGYGLDLSMRMFYSNNTFPLY